MYIRAGFSAHTTINEELCVTFLVENYFNVGFFFFIWHSGKDFSFLNLDCRDLTLNKVHVEVLYLKRFTTTVIRFDISVGFQIFQQVTKPTCAKHFIGLLMSTSKLDL